MPLLMVMGAIALWWPVEVAQLKSLGHLAPHQLYRITGFVDLATYALLFNAFLVLIYSWCKERPYVMMGMFCLLIFGCIYIASNLYSSGFFGLLDLTVTDSNHMSYNGDERVYIVAGDTNLYMYYKDSVLVKFLRSPLAHYSLIATLVAAAYFKFRERNFK